MSWFSTFVLTKYYHNNTLSVQLVLSIDVHIDNELDCQLLYTDCGDNWRYHFLPFLWELEPYHVQNYVIRVALTFFSSKQLTN